MTFGSRIAYANPLASEMIRHARIFIGKAFLATDDLNDLWSGNSFLLLGVKCPNFATP